ncbi:hypothetical protein [Undibacterium terreum]|uniref:Uncharacterized protein n=1 Tax=Undibacterium terreum TaxID=1224302 RepID=A0A916UB04_9BURK|nr:hypothetical protein [Undibacterium terreum]GGC67093.1 hypothetical protein GCM10011396_12590 [Undibacterium terreum]
MTKTWCVSAIIPFPMIEVNLLNGHIGFPEKMEWASRLVESTINAGDVSIYLKKCVRSHWIPYHRGGFCGPAKISLVVDAEDANSALEKVDGLLEDVCDNLAIRLHSPIPIVELEVLDITAPFNLGDERVFLLYPFPNGYKPPKFQSCAYLNSTQTETFISLSENCINLSKRQKAALRWYHKALTAEFEIDRFIFLMIVLEILCTENDEKISAPFRVAKCGHEIPECPTCGVETKKEVNGLSLKSYLVKNLKTDESDARDIWNFRQLVHGANDLSDKKTKDVSTYCLKLQAAVTLGIKNLLGIDENMPPLVSAEAIGISTSIILGGKRPVTENDLSDVPIKII